MNFIIGGNDSVNRKAVENSKVDILISPERGRKKDFMKSRNSGLNQVLAKLASKNKVAIGFDFNYVLNSSDRERPNIIGKMKLNVRLCRKYKVNMIVCNSITNKKEERNEDSLKAFGRVLGMDSLEVIKFKY
jgi:ribonuclease P/MRP protein subunit RPP1